MRILLIGLLSNENDHFVDDGGHLNIIEAESCFCMIFDSCEMENTKKLP